MRTEGREGGESGIRLRGVHSAILAAFALCVTPDPAAGQASLFLVDAETQVRSVGVRFVDHQTFSRSRLSELLTYSDPGSLVGVRRTLAVLPFVSAPTPVAFVPLELQRDLARLRRFYRSAGFPSAELSYDVSLDQERNVVDITFVIREGEPLRRGYLAVSAPGGSDLGNLLPEELRSSWTAFTDGVRPRAGDRFGELELLALRDGIATWLKNRGWAFARVVAEVAVDSIRGITDVNLTVDPGPLARVDSIAVRGNSRLSDALVRRAIPLHGGDVFSARRLADGQEHLASLDIVRFARTDVSTDQPEDSTVTVVAQVDEGLARLITVEGGYATEVGVTVAASWAHRDFVRGARTLTISATGQTGLLGFADRNATRYGGALSLKQPLLFDPRSTGVVRPHLQYRDDLLDRSFEVGADLILIYQPQRSQSISLGYGVSQRHVFDFRGGGDATTDLLTRLAILDSLDTHVRTSALTATWLSERLDDSRDPSQGHVVRADLELAGPSTISTVEYGRLDVSLAGVLRLSEGASLLARISVGRLLPFGESIPGAGESPIHALLPLRDVVFAAGGSHSVRGWGEQMLGPKIPDYIGDLSDPATVTAERYVPIGGLARSQTTLELRMPLPFLDQPRGLVAFLDSGRVWYPDARFRSGTADSSKRFYSTGGGFRFATPIGPVGVVLGYKLNPSILDLRDPGEVTRALVEERSILDVPAQNRRRFHLHITLGADF